jgi:hypothetical protein
VIVKEGLTYVSHRCHTAAFNHLTSGGMNAINECSIVFLGHEVLVNLKLKFWAHILLPEMQNLKRELQDKEILGVLHSFLHIVILFLYWQ